MEFSLKDICSQQASDVTCQIRKYTSLGPKLGVVVTGLGWPKNIYLRAQRRLLGKGDGNQKGLHPLYCVSFQSQVIVLCSAKSVIVGS